jgi:hypothetical protein
VAEQIYKDLIAEVQEAPSEVARLDDATFRLRSGRVMHFYTAEELLNFCEPLKCLHFFEGRELDETHGEPHYHSFLAYVGIKPPNK